LIKKIQFSNFGGKNGNRLILLKTDGSLKKPMVFFSQMPIVITLIRRWFDYRIEYRGHAQARSSSNHAQSLIMPSIPRACAELLGVLDHAQLLD
jgi:hypothetical protein